MTSELTPTGPRRPNILLLFPDQHRSDWLGTTPGLPVPTPNLDALAGRGVRFSNAITPSPLSAPARACLAAGREYDSCRVPDNGVDYPGDQATFYTLLRNSGYHVMGCGKFDLAKKGMTWGADGSSRWAEWGFSDGVDNEGKWDGVGSYRNAPEGPKGPHLAYLERVGQVQAHLADYDARRGKHGATFATPLSEDAYCDNWIAGQGLELLRRTPEGKPWFLQVNFNGPHDPWDITERMEAECRQWMGFPRPIGQDGDEAGHEAVRQNYSAMVANIDRWVGVFLEELRSRGELDNTLVIYSSDHGEMLGDHGAWGKGRAWQQSVGVPLIVAGLGVREGVVLDGPATTLDLTATFLDFAGLRTPERMESMTMRPLLEGRADHGREYVVSGLRDWRVVFDGRKKLVIEPGARHLYDLEQDPEELTDLADSEQRTVERLMNAIRAR